MSGELDATIRSVAVDGLMTVKESISQRLVKGKSTYHATRRVATFVPTELLRFGCVYSVTLHADKFIGRHNCSCIKIWSFTTAAARTLSLAARRSTASAASAPVRLKFTFPDQLGAMLGHAVLKERVAEALGCTAAHVRRLVLGGTELATDRDLLFLTRGSIVEATVMSAAMHRQALKSLERALNSVRRDGLLLEHFSATLQGDDRVVAAAVAQNGAALQFASTALRNNGAVALAAVRSDGMALKFVSTAARAERQLVMAAVAQNGAALQFASTALRNDGAVVLAAVRNDGMALQHAGLARMGEKAVASAALEQDAGALGPVVRRFGRLVKQVAQLRGKLGKARRQIQTLTSVHRYNVDTCEMERVQLSVAAAQAANKRKRIAAPATLQRQVEAGGKLKKLKVENKHVAAAAAKAAREREDALGRLACAVCMERDRAVVFIPCAHLACSEECSAKLESIGPAVGRNKCPMCKGEIERRVRVYAA